ncbi:MAG TPA: hypothetical protein VGM06_08840 [Polyangiaceae bacterium]|jgi:hypothetical protein
MATDKSEPRVGAIFKVGVVSVVTLIGVHAALVAYFDRMARAEELRKLGQATPAALLSLRADERERLSSGPTPIEKAMHEMAAKGRAGVVPDVMPTVSKDLAPLQGWVQMPQAVPGAMTATPRQVPVAAPPDAGALAADGGVAKAPHAARATPDKESPAKPLGPKTP